MSRPTIEKYHVRYSSMFRWILALFLSYFMVVQSAMAGRATTYLHTDALGSVVAASDSGGNVQWRKVYEPYGSQIEVDNSGESLAFTGKPKDETGLSYFGARYYDPASGRFLGIDPVKVSGNAESNPSMFNRYAYANNNPYRFVDPDGREIVSANSNNNSALVNYINSRARGVFQFDSNNKLRLVRASGNEGYSEYYRDRLIEAIASPDKITVDIADKYVDPKSGTQWNIQYELGGGTTFGDKQGGDQLILITGKSIPVLKDIYGQPLRDDAADILMHELLGHAIPHVVGSDTGNAISNENKARSQITGGGQRRQEEKIHLE